MPHRLLAASELAEFLRALAHPRRIQILEELRNNEMNVASLAKATGLVHSSVSQHLMVLRAHWVVVERRDGRSVFYRLRSEELANWLVQGMDFLPPMDQQTYEVRKAIKKAKSKWSEWLPILFKRGDLLETNVMKRFQKILVGVDLSWGDHFVANELSEPNTEAVRQAMWLAKLNAASIDFFYSLDLSPKAQELISESSTDESTVLKEARNRLDQLVSQAEAEGVVANSHVVVGKSWLELIRQVLREQHDLVLVGTRHMGAFRGFFLGSTGIKLLRKCPCAVWVTQPRTGQGCDSILVPHDLRSVGDMAMELGCSMAKLQDAQLHVVHAAEFPDFDNMFPARISAERKQAYRNQAEEHIATQLAGADLPRPAKVHWVVEPPELAIMHCIEEYKVDLVVMGTVGRTGISGVITGNTAERLLPRIPCSLLAVKPPGFVSPITLH